MHFALNAHKPVLFSLLSSIPLQTVIPKAVDSLKVLAELPIVVVLMYQVNHTGITADTRTYLHWVLHLH